MSSRLSRCASLLLLSALVATAGGAAAQGRGQGHGQQDRGPAASSRMEGISDRGQAGPAARHDRRQDHRELSDAVRRVERRTGGQVLSAERVPFDGRDVNRVKVIDSSGRVRVYMDDPQSRGANRAHADPPQSARDD